MAVAALAAAPEARKAAERFWKGLLDGLGKPALERTRVYEDKRPFKRARGKKTIHETYHFPGVHVERGGGHRVESISIPRWAALAVALGAGASLDPSAVAKLKADLGKLLPHSKAAQNTNAALTWVSPIYDITTGQLPAGL